MADTPFVLSPEEAECSCLGTFPDQVRIGLDLFNAGEFFEAHEVLELAWRAERDKIRELYRGILQISVAYYHITRGNYVGALKMFGRAKNWLDPFPTICQGIDLAHFRVDYLRVEEMVHRLGPEHIDSFDRSLFRPINYQS